MVRRVEKLSRVKVDITNLKENVPTETPRLPHGRVIVHDSIRIDPEEAARRVLLADPTTRLVARQRLAELGAAVDRKVSQSPRSAQAQHPGSVGPKPESVVDFRLVQDQVSVGCQVLPHVSRRETDYIVGDKVGATPGLAKESEKQER